MFQVLLRFFNGILILIAVFMATRCLVRTLPGDPIETLIAESGTSVPSEIIRQELGLDRPFAQAIRQDIHRWIQGDLGNSLITKKPIAPLLIKRLFKTGELTLIAGLLTLILSLSLGLPSAAHPEGWTDKLCTLYGSLSAALPIPWIGPIILLVFAVWIPLFPVGGHPSLPALALALNLTGFWARLIRQRVRESLFYGPAQGARARGIPEWKVLLKYGLAPVSGSLVAYFGTQLGALLAGSFVVEMIFDWQGLGRLLVDAVLKRDYPVVEAATFLASAMSLLGIFFGDWLQKRIDRRLPEAEEV